MSLPLFEISQTVNGITTSTTYGVGFGCFILVIAYFIPTIFKLVMARYYPKKTILDQIDMQTIMTLLPLITSLFEKPRRPSPSSFTHSHESTDQTRRADDAEQTMMMFEIMRQQNKDGETETENKENTEENKEENTDQNDHCENNDNQEEVESIRTADTDNDEKETENAAGVELK